MYRVIAGATGLIGQHLVKHWLNLGHSMTVIGRNKAAMLKLFGPAVKAVSWDELTVEILQPADIVVNLAGASIAETRWSLARKKVILDSRLQTTNKLANLLAELGDEAAPRLFNASAIGIYGLQQQYPDDLPPRLQEQDDLDWNTAPDFLSYVGRAWEKAAEPAPNNGVTVVFLRFGVVLAKEGGALPLIKRQFNFFLGGAIGTGKQAFSWVAIDDVIRAIDFLANKQHASGPYNIVAPGVVTQMVFAQTLARVLHRPAIMRLPTTVVELMFGEMGHELLLEGQNVYPSRLLESGFEFSYPDINSALNHILR